MFGKHNSTTCQNARNERKANNVQKNAKCFDEVVANTHNGTNIVPGGVMK